MNFFRVGRVGKPHYILHSEVKEIYNTSYTVTRLYGIFVLGKQNFWFSFNMKICGKEKVPDMKNFEEFVMHLSM